MHFQPLLLALLYAITIEMIAEQKEQIAEFDKFFCTISS